MQLDRLDTASGRLASDVEPLSLSATRLRVIEQHWTLWRIDDRKLSGDNGEHSARRGD